jgi:hypothetical protein
MNIIHYVHTVHHAEKTEAFDQEEDQEVVLSIPRVAESAAQSKPILL